MWWMFIICCVWTLYECDHSSILIISLHFFSGEHSYILTAHFLHKLFIIKVCFLLVIKGLTQHAAPVKRSVSRGSRCLWPLLCFYISVYSYTSCVSITSMSCMESQMLILSFSNVDNVFHSWTLCRWLSLPVESLD